MNVNVMKPFRFVSPENEELMTLDVVDISVRLAR